MAYVVRQHLRRLVNVGALPFVLILGAISGEALLRALGFFKQPGIQ